MCEVIDCNVIDCKGQAEGMLSAHAARLLGCLMEKQMTTPDYYPLTLKALTAACNQKSSRVPVLNLTLSEVGGAVNALRAEGLFDLLDGVVARTTGKTTKFGAVFDWIADKWVDGLVLGAIGFTYASPFVAIMAITLSMLHSFVKPVAYAEIGYTERRKGKIVDPLEGVGFFGRPETHITIILFSILERSPIPLGLGFGIKLVALLTLLSLLMRIIYLYRKYGKEYE